MKVQEVMQFSSCMVHEFIKLEYKKVEYFFFSTFCLKTPFIQSIHEELQHLLRVFKQTQYIQTVHQIITTIHLERMDPITCPFMVFQVQVQSSTSFLFLAYTTVAQLPKLHTNQKLQHLIEIEENVPNQRVQLLKVKNWLTD